jgi:hypothetical protein
MARQKEQIKFVFYRKETFMKVMIGIWLIILVFGVLYVSDIEELNGSEKVKLLIASMAAITILMVAGWLVFA